MIMTLEQIEKWRWMSKQHADGASRTWEEWHLAYHTEFARLVRNAALEEAKAACEVESHRLAEHPDYARSGAVQRMANIIDALQAEAAKEKS